MWFRDSLIAQKEYLQREKKRITQQLRVLPKGKLIKKHAHGKIYYYLENRGKRVSLFNKTKLRDEHLLKEDLQHQLTAIEQNIPILERVIKRYRPLVELNSMWNSMEAQQNDFHQQHKIHLFQGVYYRSKSEMLIAMALTSYGIAFKYESKMRVNGRYIYPDFIIKRPLDGKIFIWEHFGRMDDEGYRYKNFNRLEEYHQEGIDLWNTLIVSFDQGEGSIDMDYIDKIIKLYLLR